MFDLKKVSASPVATQLSLGDLIITESDDVFMVITDGLGSSLFLGVDGALMASVNRSVVKHPHKRLYSIGQYIDEYVIAKIVPSQGVKYTIQY